MTDADADGGADADADRGARDAVEPTHAQTWAARAYELIAASGAEGLTQVLADDFVQESRRGARLQLDSRRLLGALRTMREFDMRVGGSSVAVAGDRCLLTRRHYVQGGTIVELLAVSVWNDDGRLARLIEFDADALDEALSMLAEVSGEPVTRLDEPG